MDVPSVSRHLPNGTKRTSARASAIRQAASAVSLRFVQSEGMDVPPLSPEAGEPGGDKLVAEGVDLGADRGIVGIVIARQPLA